MTALQAFKTACYVSALAFSASAFALDDDVVKVDPLPRPITSDDIYLAPMDCLAAANTYSKGHGAKSVAKKWKGETFQSLDLDGDGVCDIAVRFDNDELSITGLTSSFLLQRPKDFAKKNPKVGTSRFSKTAILALSEMEKTDSSYFDIEGIFGAVDESDWFFPGVGDDDSSVIAMAFYSKLGGPPYIMTRGRARNSGTIQRLSDLTYDDDIGDVTLPAWNVYRWDSKHARFRGATLQEAHAVRKFAADRWREYAQRMLSEHIFHKASLNIRYAQKAYTRDWRNYYIGGVINFAGGQFEEAADDFETALDRRPPDPTNMLFNLGLSYEAKCWRQLAERAPGVQAKCDDETAKKARSAYERYLVAAPKGERVAEVKSRLADMNRSVYRTPSVDVEMSQMAQWTSQFSRAVTTAMAATRGVTMPPPSRTKAGDQQLDPAYTGQPANARVRDPYRLQPEDLRKIDTEITQRMRAKNANFTQDRIDWMIAYRAKYPDADLDDMIAQPQKYEALGWVKDWQQAYRATQKK